MGNSIEVFSPKPIDWQIGDETFTQKPLRVDKLTDVLEKMVDSVLGTGAGGLLDSLLNESQSADLAPTLMRIVISIPKSIPKIVALCLDVPKKEKYILENIRARQGLQIVKTFIEQNEVAELLQDFFGLMNDLGLESGQPKQTTKEQAKELLEAMRETETETKTETKKKKTTKTETT